MKKYQEGPCFTNGNLNVYFKYYHLVKNMSEVQPEKSSIGETLKERLLNEGTYLARGNPVFDEIFKDKPEARSAVVLKQQQRILEDRIRSMNSERNIAADAGTDELNTISGRLQNEVSLSDSRRYREQLNIYSRLLKGDEIEGWGIVDIEGEKVVFQTSEN